MTGDRRPSRPSRRARLGRRRRRRGARGAAARGRRRLGLAGDVRPRRFATSAWRATAAPPSRSPPIAWTRCVPGPRDDGRDEIDVAGIRWVRTWSSRRRPGHVRRSCASRSTWPEGAVRLESAAYHEARAARQGTTLRRAAGGDAAVGLLVLGACVAGAVGGAARVTPAIGARAEAEDTAQLAVEAFRFDVRRAGFDPAAVRRRAVDGGADRPARAAGRPRWRRHDRHGLGGGHALAVRRRTAPALAHHRRAVASGRRAGHTLRPALLRRGRDRARDRCGRARRRPTGRACGA